MQLKDFSLFPKNGSRRCLFTYAFMVKNLAFGVRGEYFKGKKSRLTPLGLLHIAQYILNVCIIPSTHPFRNSIIAFTYYFSFWTIDNHFSVYVITLCFLDQVLDLRSWKSDLPARFVGQPFVRRTITDPDALVWNESNFLFLLCCND